MILPEFPCWIDWDGTPQRRGYPEQLAELARERDMRRALYPRKVENHRMTREDADREIALIVAVHDDIGRLNRAEPVQAAPAELRWADKVLCLQREIVMRRRLYPRWISDGRLVQSDATEFLARLEAVHWEYWFEGLCWMGSNGHACQWGVLDACAAARISRDEFRLHHSRFTQPTQLEMMA